MAIAKKPQAHNEAAAEAFIRGAENASAERDQDEDAPKVHKKPAMLRFDPDLLRRVDRAAAARFQTRTAYITAAIVRALEDDER